MELNHHTGLFTLSHHWMTLFLYGLPGGLLSTLSTDHLNLRRILSLPLPDADMQELILKQEKKRRRPSPIRNMPYSCETTVSQITGKKGNLSSIIQKQNKTLKLKVIFCHFTLKNPCTSLLWLRRQLVEFSFRHCNSVFNLLK